MNRSVPAIAMAATSLAVPLGVPFIAVTGVAQAASATRVVSGSTYSMKWGLVTVRIRVNTHTKKITDVGSTLPTERPRSAQINGHARPILRSEVLRAQSASIHAVSGATMTSNAYVASLRSAIRKAHI